MVVGCSRWLRLCTKYICSFYPAAISPGGAVKSGLVTNKQKASFFRHFLHHRLRGFLRLWGGVMNLGLALLGVINESLNRTGYTVSLICDGVTCALFSPTRKILSADSRYLALCLNCIPRPSRGNVHELTGTDTRFCCLAKAFGGKGLGNSMNTPNKLFYKLASNFLRRPRE